MLTMPPEEHSMPFYFCYNCSKLAPSTGDILSHLTCLVCGLHMDSSHTGRKVILTEKEAILRSLIWKTNP